MIFFLVGLEYFEKLNSFAVWSIFAVISVVYCVGFAYEKYSTLNSLILTITTKATYIMVVQLYFLVISGALISASFLNKLLVSETDGHILVTITVTVPIIIVSISAAVYRQIFYRCHSFPTAQVLETSNQIWAARKELTARTGCNFIVGAFLSKWYFFIPLYLQYNEHWSRDSIANTLILSGILSFLINIIFSRVFYRFATKNVLAYFLLIFLMANLFIGWNLYMQRWIFISVVIMAIFYSSLQNLITKIIFHDVITYSSNMFLLLLGNFISIVFFGFICTLCSIFLVGDFGVARLISTSVVLITATLISIYSYYQMKCPEMLSA